MEAKPLDFNHLDSVARIDELLRGADVSYEDKSSIPDRSMLTFSNGFYVNATALFVDLRGSKNLPQVHKKPTLAKVYRSYISEAVAVMKGHSKVNEIYIEGDGVWAVFDTPLRQDIDEAFCTAARVASLIDILNYKFNKVGIASITAGIGMAYGESLCIKAGHKNSGVNDVVWLGAVVGEASRMCSFANRSYSDFRVMLTPVVYNNLNDEFKKLATWNLDRECYHANVINLAMDEWLKSQQQEESWVLN
jgi:class 3 adenylate cyclase